MPTLSIADFRHGLDLRRPALTAVGGSLQIMDNAVVTAGGEVAKRKAFVPVAFLTNDCFGLTGSRHGLHVFGTSATPNLPPVPMPDKLTYHQLAPPSSGLRYVSDVEIYKGKFWVSADLLNNTRATWWDGQLLPNGGNFSRTYRSKVYRTDTTLLRFSSVDNPGLDDNTTANPGGGFIDVSANDSDTDDLMGLEIFYSALAVFARRTVQLWAVDPDPTLNTLKQVLRIGTVSPRSVRQFGNGDVLFLSDAGIRSLHALNTSLAAGVVDVGAPIDALTTARIVAGDPGAFVTQAVSVVEPNTGRYWLAIGSTVYVLSFWPGSKISAWSTFSLPFQVRDFAVVDNRLYCSDTANNIYLYGGVSGNVYDATVATVRTPHLDGGKPTVLKKVSAVSAICQGPWTLRLGAVADRTDLFETVANISGSTVLPQTRIAAPARGTHVAMEAATTGTGPALLSSLAFDYSENEKL